MENTVESDLSVIFIDFLVRMVCFYDFVSFLLHHPCIPESGDDTALKQVNSTSSKTCLFAMIFFLGSVMAETVRISAAGVGPHRAVGAWRGSP